MPRIAETPSAGINAVGLQNDGVEAFIRHRLPALPWQDVPVIANIYASCAEDFGELAGILSAEDGVAAVEVNISCRMCGKAEFSSVQDRSWPQRSPGP